jgi:hypothetical protein
MQASDIGRTLIALGIVMVIVGVLLTMRVPWLGRLPGDFSFGGPNWKVYVPLGTCLVLSVLLTLVSYVISMFASRR